MAMTHEDPTNPILFWFPEELKKVLSFDVETSQKDYTYKTKNIERYIYDACQVLQLCGVSYNKYITDLSRYTDEELKTGAGQMVGINFEIEARLHLRRLMERFVELKNFCEVSQIDREKTIRQYHLLKVLQAYSQKLFNEKEFIAEAIHANYYEERIENIKKELGVLSSAFYLDTSRSIQRAQDIPYLIKRFNGFLKLSLPLMNDMEKQVMGNSYQQYAETSNVLHSYSGLAKFKSERYHNELKAIYAMIHIISICILKDLAKLAGPLFEEYPSIISGISLLKNDLPDFLQISVGDEVVVRKHGVKGRVLEIKESQYKIKIYKLEFVEKIGVLTVAMNRDRYLLGELMKYIPDSIIVKDIEICPICRKSYSARNKKVQYHLQYRPVPKFIYACSSCNYAEYLSRHWKRHLKPWHWYKIKLVRKFGREYKNLIH